MFLFLHLGRDLSVHSVLAFVSRASAFHLVWPMQILKFNFAGNFNCVKGQPKVGGNMNYEHPQKYAQQHPFWLAAISYFIPRFIIKFFFFPHFGHLLQMQFTSRGAEFSLEKTGTEIKA